MTAVSAHSQDPHGPLANLLNGLESSTRLYRFLRTGVFRDLVSERRLILSRPQKWDDPFENFLSKTILLDRGEQVRFNLTNDFFGQCWTVREECDGMWRNYCSLREGVRIGTTAEKLICALWDSADEFASLRTFVGRVRYLDDDRLRTELKGCHEYGHWLTDPTGAGMAQALLLKRREFEYEHEVRAIISDSTQHGDKRPVAIEPCSFIDSVMFAPMMSAGMCADLTKSLLSHGFASQQISKSTLYDPWTLVLTR